MTIGSAVLRSPHATHGDTDKHTFACLEETAVTETAATSEYTRVGRLAINHKPIQPV